MRRLALLVAVAACSRSSAPPPVPVLTAAPVAASASAPGPAPSPAPTCTSSIESRTADARSQYGASVRLATVDSTFLFIDPDHTPLFAESVRLAPQVLSALRHDRIAPKPLCPVSVYLLASQDRFNAWCLARGVVPDSGRNLGVYDRAHGEIATDLSGGARYVPSTAHELAHVLMDADWEAPLWFRECVASQYESPVLASGDEIHGTDDWRYDQRRAAVRAHDPDARMGALFGMSDDDFRAKLDTGGIDGTRLMLQRAMARATCQWLDAQGQLWPLYQGWRDSFATDPDGVAAFTRVTGRPPTALEADAERRAWVLRTHRTTSCAGHGSGRDARAPHRAVCGLARVVFPPATRVDASPGARM